MALLLIGLTQISFVKTGFDRLGRDQSSFRLSALQMEYMWLLTHLFLHIFAAHFLWSTEYTSCKDNSLICPLQKPLNVPTKGYHPFLASVGGQGSLHWYIFHALFTNFQGWEAKNPHKCTFTCIFRMHGEQTHEIYNLARYTVVNIYKNMHLLLTVLERVKVNAWLHAPNRAR